MKLETYEKAKELQEAIANLEKILGFAETKGIDTMQVCFGNVNTHVKHGMVKQEIVNALEKSKEKLQREFDELEELKKTLKVGDLVKIRSDLVVGEEYGNCLFTEEMKEYQGKVSEITRTRSMNRYDLVIDNAHWNWSKQMFEG